MSIIKLRVVTLEESMGDVKERIDEVDERITNGLQSKDYVMMSLRSNVDKVNELLKSQRNILTERTMLSKPC